VVEATHYTSILHLLSKDSHQASFKVHPVYLQPRAFGNEHVIAASLAKFGALGEDMLPKILVLLTYCQMDMDEEVRDQVTH
jgi:hypothetical protein